MLYPIKWRMEKERISALRDNLLELGDFPSPFNYRKAYAYSAEFYNICSFFEDEAPICYAPRKKRKLQKEFNSLINEAGRSHQTINRSKRGEQVTVSNTYWGGIYGICPRQTGKYWETSTDRCLYFGNSSDAPYSAQVLVDFLVRPAITAHRSKLLEVCELLLK